LQHDIISQIEDELPPQFYDVLFHPVLVDPVLSQVDFLEVGQGSVQEHWQTVFRQLVATHHQSFHRLRFDCVDQGMQQVVTQADLDQLDGVNLIEIEQTEVAKQVHGGYIERDKFEHLSLQFCFMIGLLDVSGHQPVEGEGGVSAVEIGVDSVL
jgi:hypothetical protein